MKKTFVPIICILYLFLCAGKVVAGYGSAPSAPVCNNEKPGQASFSYVRRTTNNQIEVAWNSVDRATSWTIAYGVEPGKYIYGMADFGDSQSRSVTINMLPPGVYYLVIKANNGCMPGVFSSEKKITVYPGSNNVLGLRVTPTPEEEGSSVISSPTPVVAGPSQALPTQAPKSSSSFWDFILKIWHAIFG